MHKPKVNLRIIYIFVVVIYIYLNPTEMETSMHPINLFKSLSRHLFQVSGEDTNTTTSEQH